MSYRFKVLDSIERDIENFEFFFFFSWNILFSSIKNTQKLFWPSCPYIHWAHRWFVSPSHSASLLHFVIELIECRRSTISCINRGIFKGKKNAQRLQLKVWLPSNYVETIHENQITSSKSVHRKMKPSLRSKTFVTDTKNKHPWDQSLTYGTT